MLPAFRATVSGKVQMVMYRDFVKTNADMLGVVGTVANMPEGTVEVVAEGEKDALERFVVLLNEGPELAEVSSIEVEWRPPQGVFKDFSILY